MASCCVAYGCGKTPEDGVTLFKFPKDPDEFRKWEKQVQRTRSKWLATPNSQLCSDHFGREYFEARSPSGALKLRPGAAPTVFLRPLCSSCRGEGCRKCLHAGRQRRFTAEATEHRFSDEHDEAQIEEDDADRWNAEHMEPTGALQLSMVCEMCGKTGSFFTFFSKTKRFCSTSCSRSYSSNSKKSTILARLQVARDFCVCLAFLKKSLLIRNG